MSTATATRASTISESVSKTDAITVLIIDDTLVGLKSAAVVLRNSGFNTLTAEGGEAAFKILEKHDVGLIVLDYQMPEMNGLEFLRSLRADSRYRDVKVIMLTSASDKTLVVEAMRLGIAGYLLKSKDVLTALSARVCKVFEIQMPAGLRETHPPKERQSTTVIAAIQCNPESNTAASPQPVGGINLVPREKTIEAVLDLTCARTLPGIVKRVNDLCSAGTTNLAELAAIIGQDPILSVRVLQLARSTAKARAKICTVHDAI